MTNSQNDRKNSAAYLVLLTGRVQGVGMRPYIYRRAKSLGLCGYVYNRPDGVIIHIEGNQETLECFLNDIARGSPQAASIKNIVSQPTEIKAYSTFEIQASRESTELITEICPDIAVCPECLAEFKESGRRSHYPFINCTNCGPRFTLVRDFPYDRINTTMHEFQMCPECQTEYEDPADRRFHAQPTSCPNCGPVYKYIKHGYSDQEGFVSKAASDIDQGKIIVIKGLGGYNLACNANNVKAVSELRFRKNREKKPFAIMFRSIDDIISIANIDESEIKTLLSWQRPIVILNMKENSVIAKELTSGLNTIGAFLPYLPLHYLLFEKIQTSAIVVTSCNESEVPIMINDLEAIDKFSDVSGGLLSNNRIIARRNDDSVVRIIHSEPRLMRRARGYVPSPIDLDFDADGILACGAELSNCFCIGKRRQAILSQHIGDLKNAETYAFYCENIKGFSDLYRFNASTIACDLHPEYLSTKFGSNLKLPIIQTQHHHAHIAACMAEYKINEPVIGVSFDGTGYGLDGNIWGSEVFEATLTDFKRISHFEYAPIPGGDLATKETWRSALSYLYLTFADDWKRLEIPFLKQIDLNKAGKLSEAIDKKINSPLCCSAGRLFDAIAAILCICLESDYHAEAPLLLENYLDDEFSGSYSFQGFEDISFRPLIREIVTDIIIKTPINQIVTQFHNTIAAAALYQINLARRNNPLLKIVISGGTFQNKYLTEKVIHLLTKNGLEVFLSREVPCNDGGIALGQLAIAANKMKNRCV